MPEDLLKRIRLYIAENPVPDVDGPLEMDMGKSYDISAKVELAGAFQKEGKYKVVARMTDTMYHEDIMDIAYDEIKKRVKDWVLGRVEGLKPESLEIVLFDLENMSDIDQCAKY